jgi:type II secretory pathway pseudopilin PulG
VNLVVTIAMIAIFAAVALPVIAATWNKLKVLQARSDLVEIINAIRRYEAVYHRLPAPRHLLDTNINENGYCWRGGYFTFGSTAPEGRLQDHLGQPLPYVGNFLEAYASDGRDGNNSLVMEILLDTENKTGRNPRKIKFLERKINGTKTHGIGPDLVFRDPWGTPYIIGYRGDGFYANQAVSEISPTSPKGLVGMKRGDPPYGKSSECCDGFSTFLPPDDLTVWSFGPDRQANSGVPANQGVNFDNILSWFGWKK